MKHILLLILSTLLVFSCAKQEGEGGLASITGVVMVQNINSLLQPSGKAYPAKDKVYILYGSSTFVDDDVNTSPTGEFKFDYLMPGNYTLYVYSDDTARYKSKEKITLNTPISISKKKDKLVLDTITIYKHVDFDDGSASISGFVYRVDYYSYFSPENNAPKDTIPGQNYDVFITYQNDSVILDRIRTSHDGSFKFPYLVPGKYTIFTLSEMPFSKKNIPVSAQVTITDQTSSIHLAPFFADDF